LTYLTYARQFAALKKLLLNLAYANDFAPNLQPYFKLVPGRLTLKDEYAERFYCGQNMESLSTYFKYVDYFAEHAYFHANLEYVNTLRKYIVVILVRA